ADADWPENKKRHVFGPHEMFEMSLLPHMSFENVNTGTCSLIDLIGSDKCVLRAYKNACRTLVGFTINGAQLLLPIEVITPTNIVGVSAHVANRNELTVFAAQAQSGDGQNLEIYDEDAGVIMVSTIALEPMYVNFGNISVYEGVAMPTNRCGWFANLTLFPDSCWIHDESRGAVTNPSSANNVKMNGNIENTYDYAGYWFGCCSYFENGSIEWHIPNYWVTNSEKNLVSAGTRFCESVQCMSVNSNGTTTVSKYGFTVERQKGEEIWSD
ncbi:MAG: hypothetical protein ILO34_04620, partial [Kiritimatiellae bacterium]|nr:hypothetical protein [Kiritimatiellia bacterium]